MIVQIRRATEADIPAMRKIFDYGRKLQLETGNLNQWAKGYPSRELMQEDILNKAAHVCLGDDEEMIGVFSLFTEPDPTYQEIEGAWLNNQPYATIHRIASSGVKKGVGQYCIQWVQKQFDNVRIDTHKDNQPMKYVLEKLGFVYCGVIYLENGDPRDAYQYSKHK